MAKKVYQKHVLSLTSLFFPFRGEKTDRLVSPSTSQLLVLSSEMGARAGRATDHFLFLFKKVLICLAVPGLQSSLWHAGSWAVPWSGIKPGSSALEAWNIRYWATRKVPAQPVRFSVFFIRYMGAFYRSKHLTCKQFLDALCSNPWNFIQILASDFGSSYVIFHFSCRSSKWSKKKPV